MNEEINYIIYKEGDATKTNKTHPYYDQIQGQLHITRRQTCYLVVWTPAEIEVVLIERDEEWTPKDQTHLLFSAPRL